jgi:hypothetical protein
MLFVRRQKTEGLGLKYRLGIHMRGQRKKIRKSIEEVVAAHLDPHGHTKGHAIDGVYATGIERRSASHR